MRNLSGDIALEYSTRETEGSSNQEVDTLSQVLNLNYNDYIYNRKLLDYILQLSLEENQENTNDNGRDGKTTFSNIDYNIYLNFFQFSAVPFEIKAKKSENPSTIINEDSIVENVFEKSDYSWNGKVKTSFGDFNYDIQSTQNDSDTELGEKTSDALYYGLGYTKVLSDESEIVLAYTEDSSTSKNFYGDFLEEVRDKRHFRASYSDPKFYLYGSYTQKDESDVDNLSNKHYTIDSIATSTRYTFSEELSIRNSIDLETSGKDDSKSTDGTFDIQWKPSKNYSADIALNISQHQVEGEGDFDNYGINLFSLYRFSKKLTNSQNASFLDVSTPSSTHQSITLGTITDYRTALSKTTNLFVTNNLSAIMNKNTSLLETTELEDDRTFIVDTLVGINKRLKFWNALNGYEFNHSENIGSNNNSSRKLKIGTFLNTLPMYNVEYNIEADITNDTKNNDNETKINIKNFVKYNHNFDVRGKLVLSGSLHYKSEKTKDRSETSLDPAMAANLMYRLWRTLTFKGNYDIIFDEQNETVNHTINAGLHYKYRNLEVDFTTDLIQQKKEKENDFNSQAFMLSVRRKF